MQIKDIMTKEAVTVLTGTSLIEAAEILFAHNFDGVPVVNEVKEVVGILTQYDLLIKGSAIHLPTFQKIITELQVYKKDKASAEKDFRKVMDLKVEDVMNKEPMVLNQDIDVDEAIRTFSEHHKVNPIPVVDDSKKLVGVMSRFDVMRLFIRTSKEVKEIINLSS